MELLDLHPTVALGHPDFPAIVMTCTIYWRQTAATERFAAYLDIYYEENPLPYGNWTTHDGKNFFCEWYDDCPPCKDSIRGPRLPGGGSWQEEDEDGLGLGHPDADDFVHY